MFLEMFSLFNPDFSDYLYQQKGQQHFKVLKFKS